MALRKYRLGELLEILDVRNGDLRYGADRVRGVNNLKKLMSTKADLSARDLSKFQIVGPGHFVFNHRTSRNGSKFSIAFNDGADDVICTEDYVVFRVKPSAEKVLASLWLYMYFNRAEFDRYVITNSWGSSTEFYNWEDLCTVEIALPSLAVQKKYVAVYQSMLANQSAYEKGLDDLKLACDAYVEELRRKIKPQVIGPYISLVDTRNRGKFGLDALRGVSIKKEFIPTKADMDGVPLGAYWVVRPRQFAYVPTTSRNGGKITLALNQSADTYIVSSSYVCFATDCQKLLPAYLMAFFSRSEFDRYARFNSWGSARETFTWEDMCEVKIPMVDIKTQQLVADMFSACRLRREVNEKLKTQIQRACPILIKGSLDEER